MARLQDFQSVSPTDSDKILIVQSQGQGLATYGSTVGYKMNKINPMGEGSLSLNRKAETTIASYSTAEGYNGTASGVTAHAEGEATTASGRAAHSEGILSVASGDRSHVEGINTIANHKSQHVFGEYNKADASTATATERGNYVEIVGNGANDANRSNARTLDWSGNETLSGDLIYKGNMSLASVLTSHSFDQSSPITLSGYSYCTFLVMGFAQGIGAVSILVSVSGGSIVSTIDLTTGAAWSNQYLTFAYSSNVLTISSSYAGTSRLTVIRG